MEALEVLDPIIEFIFVMIVQRRRVPGPETPSEYYDENVSYVKPIKLAYGFSHKICITI
jgi:hypothetical protein